MGGGWEQLPRVCPLSSLAPMWGRDPVLSPADPVPTPQSPSLLQPVLFDQLCKRSDLWGSPRVGAGSKEILNSPPTYTHSWEYPLDTAHALAAFGSGEEGTAERASSFCPGSLHPLEAWRGLGGSSCPVGLPRESQGRRCPKPGLDMDPSPRTIFHCLPMHSSRELCVGIRGARAQTGTRMGMLTSQSRSLTCYATTAAPKVDLCI